MKHVWVMLSFSSFLELFFPKNQIRYNSFHFCADKSSKMLTSEYPA
jgi:hypothetical protein